MAVEKQTPEKKARPWDGIFHAGTLADALGQWIGDRISPRKNYDAQGNPVGLVPRKNFAQLVSSPDTGVTHGHVGWAAERLGERAGLKDSVGAAGLVAPEQMKAIATQQAATAQAAKPVVQPPAAAQAATVPEAPAPVTPAAAGGVIDPAVVSKMEAAQPTEKEELLYKSPSQPTNIASPEGQTVSPGKSSQAQPQIPASAPDPWGAFRERVRQNQVSMGQRRGQTAEENLRYLQGKDRLTRGSAEKQAIQDARTDINEGLVRQHQLERQRVRSAGLVDAERAKGAAAVKVADEQGESAVRVARERGQTRRDVAKLSLAAQEALQVLKNKGQLDVQEAVQKGLLTQAQLKAAANQTQVMPLPGGVWVVVRGDKMEVVQPPEPNYEFHDVVTERNEDGYDVASTPVVMDKRSGRVQRLDLTGITTDSAGGIDEKWMRDALLLNPGASPEAILAEARRRNLI